MEFPAYEVRQDGSSLPWGPWGAPGVGDAGQGSELGWTQCHPAPRAGRAVATPALPSLATEEAELCFQVQRGWCGARTETMSEGQKVSPE